MPPTLMVPTTITATCPANMTNVWNTSVQITALSPPYEGKEGVVYWSWEVLEWLVEGPTQNLHRRPISAPAYWNPNQGRWEGEVFLVGAVNVVDHMGSSFSLSPPWIHTYQGGVEDADQANSEHSNPEIKMGHCNPKNKRTLKPSCSILVVQTAARIAFRYMTQLCVPHPLCTPVLSLQAEQPHSPKAFRLPHSPLASSAGTSLSGCLQ